MFESVISPAARRSLRAALTSLGLILVVNACSWDYEPAHEPDSTSEHSEDLDPRPTVLVSASTPFCRASEDFHIAATGADYVPSDDVEGSRAMVDELRIRLDAATSSAPSSELARPTIDYRASFERLVTNLESFDYDIEAMQESPVMEGLNEDLYLMADVLRALRGFLVRECGSDIGQLDIQAQAWAAGLLLFR